MVVRVSPDGHFEQDEVEEGEEAIMRSKKSKVKQKKGNHRASEEEGVAMGEGKEEAGGAGKPRRKGKARASASDERRRSSVTSLVSILGCEEEHDLHAEMVEGENGDAMHANKFVREGGNGRKVPHPSVPTTSIEEEEAGGLMELDPRTIVGSANKHRRKRWTIPSLRGCKLRGSSSGGGGRGQGKQQEEESDRKLLEIYEEHSKMVHRNIKPNVYNSCILYMYYLYDYYPPTSVGPGPALPDLEAARHRPYASHHLMELREPPVSKLAIFWVMFLTALALFMQGALPAALLTAWLEEDEANPNHLGNLVDELSLRHAEVMAYETVVGRCWLKVAQAIVGTYVVLSCFKGDYLVDLEPTLTLLGELEIAPTFGCPSSSGMYEEGGGTRPPSSILPLVIMALQRGVVILHVLCSTFLLLVTLGLIARSVSISDVILSGVGMMFILELDELMSPEASLKHMARALKIERGRAKDDAAMLAAFLAEADKKGNSSFKQRSPARKVQKFLMAKFLRSSSRIGLFLISFSWWCLWGYFIYRIVTNSPAGTSAAIG